MSDMSFKSTKPVSGISISLQRRQSYHGPFRCIDFDMRGYGQSERPSQRYDMEVWADDVAALMEHLELHSAHIHGTSMGGMVARQFASDGDSASAEGLGVTVPLIVNNEPIWKTSEGNDIAVVPLPPLAKYKELHAVGIADFGSTEDDLSQGALDLHRNSPPQR